MSHYFGNIIRAVREQNRMTQKALCDDLCTIRQLSRIENNESSPSAYIVQKFSERLGLDLLGYLPYADEPNGYQIKCLLDEAYLAYHKLHYDETLVAIQPLVDGHIPTVTIRQEVHWLYFSALIHVDINVQKESLFIDLLRMTRSFKSIHEVFKTNLSWVECNIISTIVYIHLMNEAFETAERILEDFTECLHQNIRSEVVSNLTKALYNLSRLYLQSGRHEKAADTALKGILLCQKKHEMLYLDMLSNVYGRALYFMGREVEGRFYIMKYIVLSMFRNENHKLDSIYQSLYKNFCMDQFKIEDYLDQFDFI